MSKCDWQIIFLCDDEGHTIYEKLGIHKVVRKAGETED